MLCMSLALKKGDVCYFMLYRGVDAQHEYYMKAMWPTKVRFNIFTKPTCSSVKFLSIFFPLWNELLFQVPSKRKRAKKTVKTWNKHKMSLKPIIALYAFHIFSKRFHIVLFGKYLYVTYSFVLRKIAPIVRRSTFTFNNNIYIK